MRPCTCGRASGSFQGGRIAPYQLTGFPGNPQSRAAMPATWLYWQAIPMLGIALLTVAWLNVAFCATGEFRSSEFAGGIFRQLVLRSRQADPHHRIDPCQRGVCPAPASGSHRVDRGCEARNCCRQVLQLPIASSSGLHSMPSHVGSAYRTSAPTLQFRFHLIFSGFARDRTSTSVEAGKSPVKNSRCKFR